jgi:hypothetical protein
MPIPEASRLFYRNTDDTKLYTHKYMKEMRSIYVKNMENLQKASGRLLKIQKEKIMNKTAKFITAS